MFRLSATGTLRGELEIKRSRFIGLARRVSTVEEARALLADARAEFPDARHHCSAYVVSQPNAQPIMNSSDDGEPSGTAGRPMLAVLTGHELTDISVVVVRYFGGTLLGTGGLVAAYSDSVRNVLSGTQLVSRRADHLMRLHLNHALAGKVEAEIRGRGYEVVDVEYGARAVRLDVGVADPEPFEVLIAELTSGAAQPAKAGEVLRELPAGRFPTF